jgi:ABC-2 type transport system ATP-binding protein
MAVDHIDLEIRRGDIHALIGPNGSGKSTTIKILSGILHPTEGTVSVMGHIPWKEREQYVKKIGVLFGQKTQLAWELPAIDTFQLHQKLYKIPMERYKKTLAYFMDIFELQEIMTKPVRNLSLGERMKCEITCIMLHEPELIFLDEPTIGLDVISKDSVRKMIRKINQERNVTVILTTHDMADIENLCNKVTIINHGQKVFDDTLEQLIARFSHKKIIHVKFTEAVDEHTLRSFNMEPLTPFTAKLEVDNSSEQLQKELAILFKSLPVSDLDISSVDVESIIRNLYSKTPINHQTYS